MYRYVWHHMTSVLSREIASQPDAVARLVAREVAGVRRFLAGLPPFSYALIAARGSSDHAALYARYVWGYAASMPVALAAPSLHTLYGRSPRLDGALVVGISQSGQSPDVVTVLEDARRQSRPTVALTNDPVSPLARVADHVIALGAVEESIAATVTYTSQLAAVALLAAAWSPEPEERLRELAAVPEAMAATLAGSAQPCAHAAESLAEASVCLTIARGMDLATAYESALKMRELARLTTVAFSAADFRHGSQATADFAVPVAVFMPRGPTFDDLASLTNQLEAAGVHQLIISDDDGARRATSAFLPTARVPTWLTPLVSILPAQQLAQAWAIRRGIDPDRPPGLTEKVVRTR